MAHKTEIWGKDKNARIISVFVHDGMFDVQRGYTKSSSYTIEEVVSLFNLQGAARVLGGSGSEMWSHDLSRDQFDALVTRFRKSAEKAGFTNFGAIQI